MENKNSEIRRSNTEIKCLVIRKRRSSAERGGLLVGEGSVLGSGAHILKKAPGCSDGALSLRL